MLNFKAHSLLNFTDHVTFDMLLDQMLLVDFCSVYSILFNLKVIKQLIRIGLTHYIRIIKN